MKYFKYGVLGAMALLICASCSTTEEIWINKDGSIRREITVDASFFGMMAGMQDAFANMPMMDSTNYEDETIDSDSTNLIVDRQVEREEVPVDSSEYSFQNDENAFGDLGSSEDGANPASFFLDLFQRDQLDTILDFKNLLGALGQEQGITDEMMQEELDNDSSMSKEEKAALKSMINTKIRLSINKSEGKYAIGFLQTFKDAKTLSESNNMYSILSELGSGSMPEDPATSDIINSLMGSTPVYELSKGQFSIRKPAADMSGLMEQMGPAAGMLGSTYLDYKYIIHVPRKVKSVNQSGAEIEGNTIVLDAPTKLGASKAFELIVKYK